MIKYFFLFLIFLFCLYGCDLLTDTSTDKRHVEELPSIIIEWDETQSIVCFGTSLTYGLESIGLQPNTLPTIMNKNSFLGYQQADSAYPHSLDNKIKIKVFNQGYPRARINEAIPLLSDSVLSKNPALVLLEFCANDFLRENELNGVENGMRTLIDSILDFGSQIVIISFVDEAAINNPPKKHYLYEKRVLARNYFDMLQKISLEYDLLFVKDCFLGIFNKDDFMSDPLHPNNDGYIKMAHNIYTSLYRTFELNSMLQ